MPNRRRRSGSSGGSGVFWLDRLIGGLSVLFGLAGALLFLYVLVTHSALLPVPRGVAVFGLLSTSLHTWGGVHLFQGHRLGLVVIAVLLVLSPYVVGVGLSAGWLGKGIRAEDLQSGGIPFLLLFCIARLGGWGPKPR